MTPEEAVAAMRADGAVPEMLSHLPDEALVAMARMVADALAKDASLYDVVAGILKECR